MKELKPKIISNFIAFVALSVIAGFSLHFLPDDYKYASFYTAGLWQNDVAKLLEKILKLR